MINVITDPRIVEEALALYPSGNIDLDVPEWIKSPQALALSDDEDNVGLFEEFLPGTYTGHYFFKASGKRAKAAAIAFLAEVFDNRGCEVVRGLTPVKNKSARWMTRQLGFKDYGKVDHPTDECVVYVMTKSEFNSLHRGYDNG